MRCWCLTAGEVCVDMGNAGAQVDHGGFRAQRKVGGDAQDRADPLGDQVPVVQQLGDRAPVEVGYDQGNAGPSGCRCPELHLHHAVTP